MGIFTRLPDDVRRALRARPAGRPLARAELVADAGGGREGGGAGAPRAGRATGDGGTGDGTTGGDATGGDWAFASRSALTVVSGGEVTVQREWCDVDRAAADPAGGTITVEWVDGGAPLVLTLAPDRRTTFPQALRERVQWSVVHAAPVELPDGRSARVAVRRRTNGEMFSQVVGGADLDLADTRIAAAVDAAESRARAAVGLPA